jgi:hypothetical protein
MANKDRSNTIRLGVIGISVMHWGQPVGEERK